MRGIIREEIKSKLVRTGNKLSARDNTDDTLLRLSLKVVIFLKTVIDHTDNEMFQVREMVCYTLVLL